MSVVLSVSLLAVLASSPPVEEPRPGSMAWLIQVEQQSEQMKKDKDKDKDKDQDKPPPDEVVTPSPPRVVYVRVPAACPSCGPVACGNGHCPPSGCDNGWGGRHRRFGHRGGGGFFRGGRRGGGCCR